MSSLRATDAYPPRRTQRIQPMPTQVLRRPRAVDPEVPLWAHRVETGIETLARFGYAPTPTILVVSAIVVGAALRHG